MFLDAFATVSLIWYCILWGVGLLGWRISRLRYRNRPKSPISSSLPHEVPGVSILRPLKGLDANLFENLESTCIQDYPKFEILFSVADENDQALRVVHELLEKYPDIDAKIIIGEEIVGVNPKVNNLMRPYKQAAHDILWVLDSNVLVHPGTLSRAVDILSNQTHSKASSKRPIALVHHVPFAFLCERSLGSRVEEAFLNTNHAKMYIALNMLSIDSCVTGKSCLYRRSDVEKLAGDLKPKSHTTYLANDEAQPSVGSRRGHGLAVFGRFMAEDNMIGAGIWHELGFRHDLSCDVAENAIGSMSLMDYVWRRVRWIRVRKHMVLAATIMEPLSESVVVGVLAAWSASRLLLIPMWLFLLLHFSMWLLVDLDVYTSLAGHPVPKNEQWPFFCAWVIREALALPIWALAIGGSEVIWRGTKYQMLPNGECEPVDEHSRTRGWAQGRRGNYEPLAGSAP